MFGNRQREARRVWQVCSLMLRRGVWLTWSGCLKYSVLSKRIMEQTMCCSLQSCLAFCQHMGGILTGNQLWKSHLIARLIGCSRCCRDLVFSEVYWIFWGFRLCHHHRHFSYFREVQHETHLSNIRNSSASSSSDFPLLSSFMHLTIMTRNSSKSTVPLPAQI